MFVAGRILKNKQAQTDLFSLNGKSTWKDKNDDRFRCIVPFLPKAFTVTLAGITIILVGLSICIIAYKWGFAQKSLNRSDKYSTKGKSNCSLHASIDSVEIDHMQVEPIPLRQIPGDNSSVQLQENSLVWKYFSFLGPFVMSFGSFLIVFSCVVVCEKREKLLAVLKHEDLLKEDIRILNFEQIFINSHKRPITKVIFEIPNILSISKIV